MFFSKQLLCFHKQPLPLFISNSRQLLHNDNAIFKDKRVITNPFSSSSYSCCIVQAVKEDSQQYEVDPDKAREALQKLDQEFQSLSNKQIPSPKLKASDVRLSNNEVRDTNQKLEISESFLAYLAGGLLFFTIFYNVLFITVIKPAIDGP